MTKKLLVFSVLLATTSFVLAQDYTIDGNSIKISKVIENTNLTIDQENEVLLTYLGKTYNDINTTLKTNTAHSIVVKGIYPEVVKFTMGLWKADLGHQIVISLKDGRVRVEVSVTQVRLYSSQTSVDYVITDFYPVTQNMSPWNYMSSKSKSEEMVNKAVLLMNATILELENALKNHFEDDNW
ncbi:MAG: hypothetical protein J6I41_08865 [Bacteroidales bacterium]|nr:hypothetical protein [Bacteroidales bacterium]